MDASPARVEVRCPAKLNLCLSVGAADPAAGGRHRLASAMLPLSLHDDLAAVAEPGGGIRLDRRWAADAPVPSPIDWPAEADLAWRAAAAFGAEAGGGCGVRLTLRKRIPCGGGLGGGSADAAGVLHAMDRLRPGRVAVERLKSLAAGLGSDVAFALAAIRGGGAALVSGFGERVEPLAVASDSAFHATLVFPAFGCPTGPVFAALDARRAAGEAAGAADPGAVRTAAGGGWSGLVALGNDLSGPATGVRPRLRAHLDALTAAGLEARVTGSGSTLFVPAEDRAAAEAAAERARSATGLAALAVWSPDAG